MINRSRWLDVHLITFRRFYRIDFISVHKMQRKNLANTAGGNHMEIMQMENSYNTFGIFRVRYPYGFSYLLINSINKLTVSSNFLTTSVLTLFTLHKIKHNVLKFAILIAKEAWSKRKDRKDSWNQNSITLSYRTGLEDLTIFVCDEQKILELLNRRWLSRDTTKPLSIFFYHDIVVK